MGSVQVEAMNMPGKLQGEWYSRGVYSYYMINRQIREQWPFTKPFSNFDDSQDRRGYEGLRSIFHTLISQKDCQEPCRWFHEAG